MGRLCSHTFTQKSMPCGGQAALAGALCSMDLAPRIITVVASRILDHSCRVTRTHTASRAAVAPARVAHSTALARMSPGSTACENGIKTLRRVLYYDLIVS